MYANSAIPFNKGLPSNSYFHSLFVKSVNVIVELEIVQQKNYLLLANEIKAFILIVITKLPSKLCSCLSETCNLNYWRENFMKNELSGEMKFAKVALNRLSNSKFLGYLLGFCLATILVLVYTTMLESVSENYVKKQNIEIYVNTESNVCTEDLHTNRVVNQLANGKTNFSGESLQCLKLKNFDLKQVDFSKANLSGAEFEGANLNGSNLVRADLSGAKLVGANLVNANLEYSKLKDADLEKANLTGANLVNANLYLTNLANVNLSNANLAFARLTGANLELALLSDANLEFASLVSANLRGANLVNSELLGTGLIGTNIEQVNFTGANLEDAIR